MSYKYVPLNTSKPYSVFCSSKMNELKQALQKEGIICAFYGIGSYAKHMVTQNGKAPFDLDYNLEITKPLSKKYSDLKKLKDIIRREMDKRLNDTGFSCGKDSTSAITYILHLPNKSQMKFSFDIGIVSRNKNGDLQRLIHNKDNDSFTWNVAKDSKEIEKRARILKTKGYTSEIKSVYLKKKNGYLSKGEKDNHPSFNVYIETVNEIYRRHFEKDEKLSAPIKKQDKKQKYLAKINQSNAYMYFRMFEQKGWIAKSEFVFEFKHDKGIVYWWCTENKSKKKSDKMRNKKSARRYVALAILKNLS